MKEVTLHIKPDSERYGSIGERWPQKITITGTPEQVKHFLDHAMYEAGCTDFLIADSQKTYNWIYENA